MSHQSGREQEATSSPPSLSVGGSFGACESASLRVEKPFFPSLKLEALAARLQYNRPRVHDLGFMVGEPRHWIVSAEEAKEA
jgi:hypothetical protein